MGSQFTLLAFAVVTGALAVTAARHRRAVREFGQYRALSPDMVIIAGFDGYWKQANPAVETVLGYSEHEVLARPFAEFVHPDDRQSAGYEQRRAKAGVPAFAFETRMLCKDGSVKRIEWTVTPFPGRRVVYAVGRDVTERTFQRMTTLVAQEDSRTGLFSALAEEIGRVLDAGVIRLLRFDGDRAVVAGTSGDHDAYPVGSHLPLGDDSVAERVLRTGRPARTDDAAGIPCFVAGRLWGVLTAEATPGRALPPDIETRAGRFTDLVATAIANAESRETLARLAEEQAALRRVATLVAHDAPSTEVFETVAFEVGRLLDADVTIVGRYDGDGSAIALGSWNSAPVNVPVGTRMAIGGRNAVTIVAETGRPARVDGYHDATGDPARMANTAGWHASIAAPIVVEGRVWGVVLVATRRTEPFPRGTEERLATFTDLVATAVANAQAHDELQRFGREQEALRRIATLVAKGARPEEVLAAVTDEVAATFGAITGVLRFEEDPGETILVGVSGDVDVPAGTRWTNDDALAATEVRRTGQAVRIDLADWQIASGEVADHIRRLGIVSTVANPITVEGRLWGVVTVNAREPLPPDTAERLVNFSDLVTTAIANAESRSELAASRRRIVAASDEVRRTIERNLHDGTQQRLVSLALAVRAAEADLPEDRDDLRDRLSGVAAGLVAAVDDLRELARGIHPAVLTQGGLGPALRALARRSAIPVDLDVAIGSRPAEPIEAAAYFVASEALANAAKHSRASRVGVTLAERGASLVLTVHDDGVGAADAGGSGLVGLMDRVEALGGSMSVESPPGEGTRINAELPLEL